MEAIKEVKVTKVDAKISSMGTPYHQVDFVEDTKIDNGQGSTHTRVWENVYFPDTAGAGNPKMLEGNKAIVHLNVYPVSKKVGGKNYTDIKIAIIKFEPCTV